MAHGVGEEQALEERQRVLRRRRRRERKPKTGLGHRLGLAVRLKEPARMGALKPTYSDGRLDVGSSMCFDSRPLTIASATFAAAWKSVPPPTTSFHAEYDESAARVEKAMSRGAADLELEQP